MRRTRAVVTVGLVGWLTAAAAAEDVKPLAPGDPVPGMFRSYIAVDERFPADPVRTRAKKMHSLVVENGLSPVCAVFTRADPAKAADGPLGPLVKRLNEAATTPAGKANNAAAFVVFLALGKSYPDEDYKVRDQKEADAVSLAKQWNTAAVPFGLASGAKEPADKPGPLTAWQVDAADETVVVVYNRLRVVGRWAFTADKPMTDADVDVIAKAFEKEAKGG